MNKTFNKSVLESRESLDIIDSHTLKNLIDKKEDLTIIDVNDKEETDARGMIQGAFNVSLGTLHYKADQEVPESFKDNRIQDRNKKVVVTCSLGLCAAIGGKLLKDMGFKDVVLLDGGVEKWVEDGYKLKKQQI